MGRILAVAAEYEHMSHVITRMAADIRITKYKYL
jgi:hypothetical protein